MDKYRAIATDDKGETLFDGVFDSTGDACEALIEHFNLSEAIFQCLWDELHYDMQNLHLAVEVVE